MLLHSTTTIKSNNINETIKFKNHHLCHQHQLKNDKTINQHLPHIATINSSALERRKSRHNIKCTSATLLQTPPPQQWKLLFQQNQHKSNKLTTSTTTIHVMLWLFLIANAFAINGCDGLLMDSSALVADASELGGGGGSSSGIGGGGGSGGSISIGGGLYLDKIGNLEKSIAAVFNKVAYGSTTTKRSIPDNVFVPSMTTVPTPPLTTFRYREREKDGGSSGSSNIGGTNMADDKLNHQQQINFYHRNYDFDLERDHALPTSAPNADILKSNSNPTYPNPNRHHNHDRDRHRHLNSTPSPSVHNLKKGPPTVPMYSGDMPSYSPPARAFFTPPLPPGYQMPFADKPTLRGTNSDTGILNTGSFVNRRPIPPPSLMPGHERIPYRPPDLVGNNGGGNGISSSSSSSSGSSAGKISNSGTSIGGGGVNQQQMPMSPSLLGDQRKKALNTPAQKNYKIDGIGQYSSSSIDGASGNSSDQQLENNGGVNGNTNNGNNGVLHFPSISRILSGSNGRKEDIPEVLLRTVTARPNFMLPIDQQQSSDNKDLLLSNNDNDDDFSIEDDKRDSLIINDDNDDGADDDDADDFDMFDIDDTNDEPKLKHITKLSTQSPQLLLNGGGVGGGDHIYSTQIVQNLANNKIGSSTISSSSTATSSSSSTTTQSSTISSQQINKNHHHHPSLHNNNNLTTSSATWTIAWNIHVYLSAILFTILAVYSIFKMIFYDKLTHLFNQSYFISIHLILIIICLARIFYLCYDAYNIHLNFNIFLSELLLNLPATFLTISFAILILFLLLRACYHKNINGQIINRYSALMRPLTIVIGSSVHVCLCITLHYVECSSNNYNNGGQYTYNYMYYQNMRSLNADNDSRGSNIHHHTIHHSQQQQQQQLPPPQQPPPPRVLSLICQIIYIFICLSLGIFYLYIYRILKRVLRNKSQNYIHGYQNLSYAIHITIATALLFILMAALQIYGAISISTTRPLITSATDIDWLQCGYQFSLRLIEIAIITLLSWVTGLKTGATKILQREKVMEQHNVSGFALFPCTSSSSQEHFETDYPAICNANTNLHTYTLRTGKPIYDDNFALNSLGMTNNDGGGSGIQQKQQIIRGNGGGAGGTIVASGGGVGGGAEYHQTQQQQQQQNSNDFTRNYETNSARSSTHTSERIQMSSQKCHNNDDDDDDDENYDNNHINDDDNNLDIGGTIIPDHYENPNFELKSNNNNNTFNYQQQSHPHSHHHHHHHQHPNLHHHHQNKMPITTHHDLILDNCYSEPLETTTDAYDVGVGGGGVMNGRNYDFKNFEKPTFDRTTTTTANINSSAATPSMINGSTEFRASKNLKAMKTSNAQTMNLDRHNYDNPDRRSSNSGGGGVGGTTRDFRNINFNNHHNNSFERRGIRKSGTLNNIGSGSVNGGNNLSGIHGRNGNTTTSGGGGGGVGTSSSISSGRTSGIQTLISSRSSQHNNNNDSQQQQQQQHHNLQRTIGGRSSSSSSTTSTSKQQQKKDRHRSSIERSSTSHLANNFKDTTYDNNIGGGGGRQMDSASSEGRSCYRNNTDDTAIPSSSLQLQQNSSSSGESATSGSMLVAEHGFVRFRALDDMGIMKATQLQQQQQHPTASFRTAGRSKEREYTNS